MAEIRIPIIVENKGKKAFKDVDKGIKGITGSFKKLAGAAGTRFRSRRTRARPPRTHRRTLPRIGAPGARISRLPARHRRLMASCASW
jgi:hypothetical protein